MLLQEQVDEMASRYKECFGEVFRFQILNSTLWVDHISERHNGWYPASSGPGTPFRDLHHSSLEKPILQCSRLNTDYVELSNRGRYVRLVQQVEEKKSSCILTNHMLLIVIDSAGGLSGKGKIPYAILALMDVIRHHPGQVNHQSLSFIYSMLQEDNSMIDSSNRHLNICCQQ